MELSYKMVIKALLLGFLIVFIITASVLGFGVHKFLTSTWEENLITVNIDNQTNRPLEIYLDNVLVENVEPHGVTNYLFRPSYPEHSIIATGVGGEKVFETNFNLDDQPRKDYYLIIIPPDAKPLEPTNNTTQE